MSPNGLRVVVAAEEVETRDRIGRVLRWKPGVTVVGQARNAIETVALVKSLQPELTLVDSRLPHHVGLDGVRLSRMSGLDTAMDILEESRAGAAVVLNVPGPLTQQEQGAHNAGELVRYSGGARIPADLRELLAVGTSTGQVVFADIWVSEEAPPRSRILEISDEVIVCGGLAVVGGLLSAVTIIGLIPGALFLILGIAAIVVGFAIRIGAKLWPKSKVAGGKNAGR